MKRAAWIHEGRVDQIESYEKVDHVPRLGS
jgi:hypothetical protein